MDAKFLLGLAGLVAAVVLVVALPGDADEKVEQAREAQQRIINAAAMKEAARSVFESSVERQMQLTPFDPDHFYRWSARWLAAEREMDTGRNGQIAACKDHLARMNLLEDLIQERAQAPQLVPQPYSQLAAATYFVREAEDWLARATSSAK